MNTIKVFLLVVVLSFFTFPVLAKENKAVTEMLEKKYFSVHYCDSHGGWYMVSSGVGGFTEGACNLDGKEIVPPKYVYVSFEGDCFIVGLPYDEKEYNYLKSKLGIIDLTGKVLLSCKYLFIQSFNKEKGLYLISYGGVNKSERGFSDYSFDSKFALYDIKNAKFITDFKYDYVEYQYSSKEKLARFNIGGRITANTLLYDAVVEGGKWGYLNEEGQEVITAKYDAAMPFKDGVAQVILNEVTSLIANPITGSSIFASSPVDTNIPQTKNSNENLFAFVFANENYTSLSGADFSINDGKSFSEYCRKTLGVSENNVRYYEDATYGNFMKALSQIKDIADVYEGDAKFIFYYSGLGMTDERTKERYLLPSDVHLETLASTGISVKAVTDLFNSIKSQYSLVLIDAPFNGKDKTGKMLAEARGVQIAAKTIVPSGNIVLALSANDNGNVYSDKNIGHSLFTYSLLEKLQADRNGSLVKDVLEYAVSSVKKQSLEQFNDVQSPQVKVSEQFNITYQSLKF